MSPDEIERITPAEHLTSVFFGFISGMPDADFLRYVSRFKDHSMVRHVFFSDVQKRLELPTGIVDEVTEELLAALENGKDQIAQKTKHSSDTCSRTCQSKCGLERFAPY
jgi:hypothetical protein